MIPLSSLHLHTTTTYLPCQDTTVLFEQSLNECSRCVDITIRLCTMQSREKRWITDLTHLIPRKSIKSPPGTLEGKNHNYLPRIQRHTSGKSNEQKGEQMRGVSAWIKPLIINRPLLLLCPIVVTGMCDKAFNHIPMQGNCGGCNR